MYSHAGVSLLSLSSIVALLVPVSSAETVLGAYIFARHGDRTSKSTPPTVLTELGYSQVHMTGSYYHDRYISSSSSSQIQGIEPKVMKAGQVIASAPDDEVLQKSTTGFFQGLYPPAGDAAKATLRNKTVIEAPLNGYQIVAIEQVKNGGNSENVAWLQSASDCDNAEASSNNYFTSDPYNELLESTDEFYKSLSPMLNGTFSQDDMNYKNAYTIFDLLNVASIHNVSDAFVSGDLLTDDTYSRLLELANAHEYNLAYNESDPIRAVSGSMLAGEVVTGLQETIDSKGAKTSLNVQFGAYATFLSFFGQAKLSAAHTDFNGIPDYASTMAFELVTNASTSSSSFPDESDISVRFLFQNGTAIPGSSDTEPTAYALFDQEKTLLPWSEFVSQMEEFSISSQKDWCTACDSSSPECSSSDDDDESSNTSTTSSGGNGGGMSKTVAGVVGALVTLAVVLGVQALVFVIGGFRLARKSAVVPTTATTATGGEKTSA